MKKQIFCIAIILLTSLGVSAQITEKAVEKIRTFYKDVSDKARLAEADAEHGETGELVMNELSINKRNHQWRAVGIYQQTYKFFYRGGDSEEHMYPDQLVMVKVERKESNRSYSEEYVFSDAGALLFYYQKSDNDKTIPGERHVYFGGIRPLRVIEDGKTRDGLSVRNAAATKEIMASAARIKELFVKSIKL